jgi:hypothetical protein
MDVTGSIWPLLLAFPSGAVALLAVVLVIWKVRHPLRTSGHTAWFLRVAGCLVVGAIVFIAVLVGGVAVVMGRL